MLLGVEPDVGQQDLSLALDVDHLVSVDHDLCEAVVVDEWTQRSERLEVTGVDAFGGCGDAHAGSTPLEVGGRRSRPERILSRRRPISTGENQFATRSFPSAKWREGRMGRSNPPGERLMPTDASAGEN